MKITSPPYPPDWKAISMHRRNASRTNAAKRNAGTPNLFEDVSA